jgi:G3E family GTPase
MIPVAVLTGFLGSGKTTLLGRLLKSPEFSRTAVIINEFGEIGLDHDLIETSEESFIELQTGCLCCTIRGDLARTLADILQRRDRGEVTAFERIVIETSGLADPAPILHALMSDAGLSERLALAGVVATVDAVNGLATLERQPESVKQVAVADRLVLTKTDLLAEAPGSRHRHRPEPVEGRAHTPPGPGSTGSPLGWQPPRTLDEGDASDGLSARLAAINPTTTVLRASFGDVDPARLFDMGAGALGGSSSHIPVWLGLDALADNAVHAHHHERAGSHDAEISCFAIVREVPIRAVALTLLLEALAEHTGSDLLRLKGLVNVAESPDRPAVIHGVQHVFHPPAWLERWPSPDRRTRLVFITRAIPRGWVEALLATIEAEVEEVMGRLK